MVMKTTGEFTIRLEVGQNDVPLPFLQKIASGFGRLYVMSKVSPLVLDKRFELLEQSDNCVPKQIDEITAPELRVYVVIDSVG